MSLVFVDGYELGGNFSDVPGRFGGRSGYTNGSPIQHEVPMRDTYIAGGAITSSWGNRIVSFLETSSVVGTHISIYLSALGKIAIYRGDPNNGYDTTTNAVLLGTGTRVVAPNTHPAPVQWFAWEAKVVVHDTAGSVEVRIYGEDTAELLLTNIDTRMSGAARPNGTISYINLAGAGYPDDFRAMTLDGTYNNDFIGDARIETIMPTAAGNSTQFTPSTGSNWQNVDENAVVGGNWQNQLGDGDTTYNSSNTVGHKDLFTLADLSVVAGSVRGIEVRNKWRKDDAAARTAKRVIRTGGTDYEGATAVSMSDSYVATDEIIEQNPNTSLPWTISNINALETGYKVES
jgi:hypothetical protein